MLLKLRWRKTKRTTRSSRNSRPGRKRLKNKKRKNKKASSSKLQAALTMDPGACRMNIERRIMEVEQLKRIADAIEEILRLVKKDMEPKKK